MKRFLVFALAISFIFVFIGCMEIIPTPFTETFENTYPVEGVSGIEVYNFNGSVTISIWDKNEVKVYAVKKTVLGKGELDNAKITVEKGNILRIKTEKITLNPQVSVTYEISIPKSLEVLSIESSNGKIKIEGTKGDCYLRSSNGGITVLSHEGNINASTSNGGIDAENINGDAFLTTSNGEMKVYNIQGKVKLETSNGAIEAKNIKRISGARTSNGKINVEILSTQEGGADIVTSNGSISCSISRKLNFNFEVSTSNGNIEVSNLDVVTQSFSENYILGKIGTGGDLLRISTSNAKIYIIGIE